jgi:DNA-binding winged helix-turn-helix (wHTH) protein
MLAQPGEVSARGKTSIDDFELHMDEPALRRAGERVTIQEQPLGILIALVRTPNEVVPGKS